MSDARVVNFIDEILFRGDEKGPVGAHVKRGRAIFDPPDEKVPEYMGRAPEVLGTGDEALALFKNLLGDDLAKRLSDFIEFRNRAESAEGRCRELTDVIAKKDARIAEIEADLRKARADAESSIQPSKQNLTM